MDQDSLLIASFMLELTEFMSNCDCYAWDRIFEHLVGIYIHYRLKSFLRQLLEQLASEGFGCKFPHFSRMSRIGMCMNRNSSAM